jgi:hypothetical protein
MYSTDCYTPLAAWGCEQDPEINQDLSKIRHSNVERKFSAPRADGQMLPADANSTQHHRSMGLGRPAACRVPYIYWQGMISNVCGNDLHSMLRLLHIRIAKISLRYIFNPLANANESMLQYSRQQAYC